MNPYHYNGPIIEGNFADVFAVLQHRLQGTVRFIVIKSESEESEVLSLTVTNVDRATDQSIQIDGKNERGRMRYLSILLGTHNHLLLTPISIILPWMNDMGWTRTWIFEDGQ